MKRFVVLLMFLCLTAQAQQPPPSIDMDLYGNASELLRNELRYWDYFELEMKNDRIAVLDYWREVYASGQWQTIFYEDVPVHVNNFGAYGFSINIRETAGSPWQLGLVINCKPDPVDTEVWRWTGRHIWNDSESDERWIRREEYREWKIVCSGTSSLGDIQTDIGDAYDAVTYPIGSEKPTW